MGGMFGVISKGDCSKGLFFGTDYHSHLGTKYAGLVVRGEIGYDREIHDISNTPFRTAFEGDLEGMRGNGGIGVISDFEPQPLRQESPLGEYAIATVGRINNLEELVKGAFRKGFHFSSMSKGGGVNPTDVVSYLINQGSTFAGGIRNAQETIQGSCSLLLLTENGLYAARDRLGRTPLVIGEKNGSFAVASESCAFPNTSYEAKYFLGPGEIVRITEEGFEQVQKPGEKMQVCAFLWIYYGFPASSYEGINVEAVRERCGRCLAKHDKDIDVDVVSGVPDSGLAHGLGYAMESGKPFRRPLVKYSPGYGRSYTPPSQEIRDHIAKMKLIPIKEVIEGNSIVVCEDSIVRGTQLKNFTVNKLWDCGAKQIHVRPACPPLMFPCRFNLSTRSTNELAARKAIRSIEGHDLEDVSEYIDARSEKYEKMVDWIARDLSVSTLRYQSLEDMVKAIGLPEENLCLYCWNGKCPKPICSKPALDIAAIKKPSAKKAFEIKVVS